MNKDTPDKGKENTAQPGNGGEKKKSAVEMLKVTALSGMYEDWFLDYASYVILERAVPHITDGLKPVHRRILHSMKRMDDGRFNKVANIIGNFFIINYFLVIH
jgi:topoisomerase-4 subunit A